MDGEDKTKAAKKFQKSYFEVLGLCCSSEVPLVENILKSLDGVKEYSVLVPTKTVIVVHDNLLISQLQIVKALNQARLEANIRVKGETSFQKKWPSPLVVASGVFLVLSLLKFFYHPLYWLALGAVAFGIFPIFLKAIASIRNLSLTNPRLDISILVLVAVVGTIAMLDFVEAGSIVFLFTVAQWLESRAGYKANAAMSSLMSLTPQKAVIVETGEEVDADEVKLNTVLAVKAGEIIPIDGIVVDGNCEVDEKTLTGESYPVLKQKNSTVWAGTINLNGYISVKTTVLAEDCVVAKMAKIVEEAQSSKSKAQRFIDKCALYYTPAIIIISAGLAIVPLALRVKNLKHWFHLALVFLVSGCPCALILSTPVVTFCVLTKAATMGVLIKGGDFLETLAKVKVMAFDKTGTITRGEFVVSDFHSLSQDLSLHTLLYRVSSIESKSSHPMAAAFVDYAKSLSIEANPDKVVEFQNFPGEGISGIIDGKQISIGNQKMGIRAGCQTGVPMLELDAKKGKSVGYVYYRGTAVGIFSLSDACRTGAEEAIEELKSLRIKTAMLTGDTQAAAMHAQQQLGNALELVHAQLLPEDKASIIKEFKNEGITAMIGDGVNDAPALAAADIGISMGISGSALATETGQVILMSNDIKKVPRTIKLARKARRKVIENVIMSISTKSGILALAFAGHPLIWAAILVDVGTCLLVIFNSMLLLRGNHNHGGKCFKSPSASKKINHNHSHCCSNPKEEKSCRSTQGSQNCASTCESTADHQTVMSSNKCSDLSEKHRGVKQCGGHCCNSFDFKANSNHSTQDHKEGAKKMKTNGHCHSKHCDKDHTKIRIKDDSLEKIVDHQLQLHPVINNCCNGHNSKSTCFSAIDNIHEDVNYTETRRTTMEACVSLEKREIGGCCKSYMKECCSKHGQFATGFGGGLSEIIIE